MTLELEPRHAEVARANLARAGLDACCEVRVGPAAETLAAMIAASEEPFDLVFIDADKPGNRAYLDAALKLTRPGSVILVDNVVRGGRVLRRTAPIPACSAPGRCSTRSPPSRASTPLRSRR